MRKSRRKSMRRSLSSLIAFLVLFGCAGAGSVLGVPTVVSETPFDLAPEITNPEEFGNTMRQEYPPLLRDARITGSVVLMASVDETGQVQQASLAQSSGHRALDDMALELAKIIQFSPAQNAGKAVPVRVEIPINLVPGPPGRTTKRIGYLN